MSQVETCQAEAAPNGSTSNLVPDGATLGAKVVQGGSIAMNADGTASALKPNGLNTADFHASSAGILASARTASGSPSMGGVKATDIVTLPNGMEVSAATAEHMGILQRTANGAYAEVTGGFDNAAKEPEQAAEVDDAEAFSDPKAEAALTELAQGVSPSLQVGAVSDVIETGIVDPATLNRAASEAGIEPSAMQAKVDATMAGFRAQALASVERLGGSDPMDVMEWAQEHQPNALKEAMQRHGLERSTKGYEDIYRSYLGSMDQHDPHSILEAEFGGGITARQQGRMVVLNIPGMGEVPYAVALKAGLIKVSDKGRRR